MSESAPAPKRKRVVETPEEFLRVLRASELVEPSRMNEVEAALGPWKDARGPMPDACAQALTDSRLLTRWQIGILREGTSRGFILGKCRLLEPLGIGGMGNVYLAEHTTLRSRVAVKVLKGLPRRDDVKNDEHLARIESHLKRFEQEARAAFRLNHPNIARAIDLDTFEDHRHAIVNFLVMDFIDGADLEKRVKSSGGLAVREAADFIQQAATGLQYAHDEGLVHRDIKPANLMVDSRGQLKILDLGLAQIDTPEGGDDASQELENKVLGTPDYMSPEQASRQRADHRSDIYSLGCTFYYLLSGHAPFEKSTAAATGIEKRKARILAHLRTPAPNILDIRPDVPAEIAALILRMMEKSPEARPQSAQQVADSLAAWLETTAAATDDASLSPDKSAGRQPRGTLGRSGSAGDSSPGIRLAGDGGGVRIEPADAGSASGPWAESDLHALSHSDAPRLSSHARSTGSMPGETVPDGPAIADESILIDTRQAPAKAVSTPRRQAAGAIAAASQPAAARVAPRAWLFRRVIGVPLVAWLSITAAILAAALTAVTLWLLSGPAVETEGDEEEPAAVAAPAKPKPRTALPGGKPPSKPRPSPKPKQDREPSPLDKILQPARPAAAASKPTAATDASR